MTHPGIANIFTRVLRIETDSGAPATAFTIEVGEKQYLVTARHVLPDQGPHKLKALGHTVEFVFEGTPVPGIRTEPCSRLPSSGRTEPALVVALERTTTLARSPT